MRSVSKLLHLVRRFWWSITARPLNLVTMNWVKSLLLTGEQSLFKAMSPADQRHHVQVARRFATDLGDDAPRAWMAAALLHDVGKSVCGLGTLGRVIATLVPLRCGDGPIARYHRHEPIGASLLRAAGSDAETVLIVGRWADAPPLATEALRRADAL